MPFVSFMHLALEEARNAAQRSEVPVGAVVVSPQGVVIGRAGNATRARSDPTAHAEILALRRAAAHAGRIHLEDCALWVTLEPCAMCAMAISHARIGRLYFGAPDPKSGGVLHGARVFTHAQTHHRPEVYDGIDARACADLLVGFFMRRRAARAARARPARGETNHDP